ncbi:MAG: KDGP aldolase family protein [Erysipelotrichia bacterium]|nr:KDGP aldolase family protein [Erysipelotrichia bacterium]
MVNFYNDKVCLNCLAGSLENACQIYEATEKHVLVGVLSANYPDVMSAVEDMKKYYMALDGNLSVGLGGGNPNQWKAVADIAKEIKANHFNQVFTAVGYTRAELANNTGFINCLVSPTGVVGKVKISTGPLSSKSEQPAIVDVETAILMAKDMGGSSLKFFPMGGLKCKDELVAVAKACAKLDFMLEPTGGIDLNNFEEIVKIVLDNGVKKVIPHVYSSIVDKASGNTKIEDVKKLMEIVKKIA